uniref:Solute carrier family 29 member 4 n=1 Tax=Calidris pygmaea TaxID=425635 RepID=A0A8C3JJ82_9CHAR
MPQSRRGGGRLATMGSVGAERFKELSPAGTPEGNVVMSFSFDSYQLEEDELQRGNQAKGVLTFMEPVSEDPEPQDRYHGIYFAMLLAGVGFLLPYNSFITDVDYLHHKYPGTSIVFDMSLTYILVALVAVILNNALVELLSLHTRISVGYLFALGPLLFVSICDVWLELFTRRQAYAINLVAVGVVAFGCTVQQSSFYGYTGLLPKRYTQGVMTGESTAGVIISLSRIFTKLLLSDEKENTVIFFFISIGMELTCFILHLLVKRTRFVRYYTSCSRKGLPEPRGAGDHGTGYRIHHDVTAEDVRFENRLRGQLSSPQGSPGPEAELAGSGTYMRFDVPRPKIKRSWPSFRDPGCPALRLERDPPSRLLLSPCGLHPPLHHVRLPQREAHLWPPCLALYLLSPHGHHQRLLWQRPHDPGCWESEPRAAGAGREHHDRVLHDGLNAGLGRGVFCLQPHQYVPQYLFLHRNLQRLLHLGVLSPGAGRRGQDGTCFPPWSPSPRLAHGPPWGGSLEPESCPRVDRDQHPVSTGPRHPKTARDAQPGLILGVTPRGSPQGTVPLLLRPPHQLSGGEEGGSPV